MIFRRSSLGKYLKRILRQKVWNDAFLDYLPYVGKIHTRMAGSHSIDIDYILVDAVMSNEQFDLQTKKSALLALNKFFWIQNDFFSMHYTQQSSITNIQCCAPITQDQFRGCLFK